MKKQYTVEKVSEMINSIIRKNRMFFVESGHRKMTFSYFIQDILFQLIHIEKGLDDVIPLLKVNDSPITINSFTFHPVLFSFDEIINFQSPQKAYDDYVNLIKELYKLDNSILIGSLQNLVSYRELANYSEDLNSIPDEVAFIINSILIQNDCNIVSFPFAEDKNIWQAFEVVSILNFLSKNLDKSVKKEFTKELENYTKRRQMVVDRCKYAPDEEGNERYLESFDVDSILDFATSVAFYEGNEFDATVGVFRDNVNIHRSTNGLEDLIDKCLKRKKSSKKAILVIPTDWLHMQPIIEEYGAEESLYKVFSRLYEGRYINTVIELPRFGRYLNSMSLLVLNTEGNEQSIRFINASECDVFDTKGICIDYNTIISNLKDESGVSDIMSTYMYKDESFYSCLLLPSVWAPICNKNQSRYVLSDIIDIYTKEKIEIVDKGASNFLPVQPENVVSFFVSHEKFYDVIVDPQKGGHTMEYRRYEEANKNGTPFIVEKIERNSIILEFEHGREIKYYGKGEPGYISTGVAFGVKKEVVTPEFLIYAINEMELPYGLGLPEKSDAKRRYDLFLSLPVVVYNSISTQISLVEGALKQEFDERLKALSADQDRFSIRSAAADIQHMLGTPFSQQQVCMELIKRAKDDSTYKKNVAALIDISEYIQRVVTSVGADISSAGFNPKDVDLVELVSQYIASYGNYSRGFFKVSYAGGNVDNGVVNIDVDLLKLQLDTIMDNADRHGFGKKSGAGNKVQVMLDYFKYKDLPYYRISVMNNGKPKNPDYSVRDFISRGNFDGESGRTGLGGYHIHQIARKHNGFVGIDSTDEWGFIVNVLIPVKPGSKIDNVKYISDDKEYV